MKKLGQIVVLAIVISILFSDESYIVKAGKIEVLEQDKTAWNFLTELNIFENKNGDTLLAPGSAGEYTFFVKNARSEEGVFTLRLKENTKLPVRYSIQSKNGDWLLGSESEKVSLASENVKVQGNVTANSELQFTLYWEWAFEDGGDIRDTQIGNRKNMLYKVLFHFQAEELSEGNADGKDMSFLIDDGKPKTGDTAGKIQRIIFVMVLAILIIIVLRKRVCCEEENIDDCVDSNANGSENGHADSSKNGYADNSVNSNTDNDEDDDVDSNEDNATGRCEC